MSNALLALAIADISPACEGEPDPVKRLEKAMAKAQDFFMSTDPDLRLRGAIGAAMQTGPEEQRHRFVRSLDLLRAASALMSGVPVDFEEATKRAGDDVIPIMAMWRKAMEAAGV